MRLAGRVLGLDVSASYYHGRWGIPTPAWAVQKPNGIVDAIVMWPRMDVLGADIAGSIEKLKGLGYWVEGAASSSRRRSPTASTTTRSAGTIRSPSRRRDQGRQRQRAVPAHLTAPEFQRGTVIPSTPFLKLTAGVDFTWNKYLYSNLQYVYGFIDEFGAGKQCYARPTR